MLRVSPARSFWFRGPGSERTIMGNVAVAEELAGSDERDELYWLDASEPDPEPEPEPDPDGDEDDPDEGDEESEPEAMPHG